MKPSGAPAHAPRWRPSSMTVPRPRRDPNKDLDDMIILPRRHRPTISPSSSPTTTCASRTSPRRRSPHQCRAPDEVYLPTIGTSRLRSRPADPGPTGQLSKRMAPRRRCLPRHGLYAEAMRNYLVRLAGPRDDEIMATEQLIELSTSRPSGARGPVRFRKLGDLTAIHPQDRR